VSVNTVDDGAGAERVAWSLFKGYERQGIESWLAVGRKTSDDPHVVPFFLSRHINYWLYSGWCYRGRLEWTKRACRWLGVEDFVFPYSRMIPWLVGAEPDLVHCHNLHGGYFDLRALMKLSQRLPVVVTLHDSWLMTGHCATPIDCPRWESGCGRCPDLQRAPAIQRDATRYNRWRKKRIFERSRLYVTTPSRWLMNRVERSILRPAVLDARVIRNGIDLRRFQPAPRQEARACLPLPQEGDLALFAAYDAVNSPYKDYATLRAAFLQLAREGLSRPLHLAVVGQAGAAERVGDLTIHHLPFLPQPQLLPFFQAADLYVHAAKEEVFGLVVAEALACGTPVVATAVGGVPEVFDSPTHGLLIPPHEPARFAEAVRCLLQDPARRSRMGREAAEHARRNFDEEVMVSSFLGWFREILAAQASDNRRVPARRRNIPVC